MTEQTKNQESEPSYPQMSMFTNSEETEIKNLEDALERNLSTPLMERLDTIREELDESNLTHNSQNYKEKKEEEEKVKNSGWKKPKQSSESFGPIGDSSLIGSRTRTSPGS